MRGYETAYHLLKARQVRGQVCMTGDQWPLGTIRRLPNVLKQPHAHELTSWASCQPLKTHCFLRYEGSGLLHHEHARQLCYHLLPKMLNPVDRLFLLPPSLSDNRERLLLDACLERLEERLRMLERLVDRDDGMYTHDAEKKCVGR